jgi:hypothetical protein
MKNGANSSCPANLGPNLAVKVGISDVNRKVIGKAAKETTPDAAFWNW